jgi:hypothetical protein
MKIILPLCIFLLIFSSCEDDSPIAAVDGIYDGLFYRSTPQQRTITSEVTLDLSGGKFAGLTSIDEYPAICQGSYAATSTEIEFRNECVFTADFDWTYILDGSYEITRYTNPDSLTLMQDVGDGEFNVFQLSKR